MPLGVTHPQRDGHNSVASRNKDLPTAVAQWLRRAAVRRNSGLIPDAAVVFLIEPENENACIEISVLVKDPLGV